MMRSLGSACVVAMLSAAVATHGQVSFAPYTHYPLPGWGSAYGVTFGDFDGDGDADLAAAAEYNPVDGRITVYTNDGAGAFSSPVSYPAGGSGPTGIAAADFNQDGRLDLVYSLFSPGATVRTLINNGQGAFAPGQTLFSGNATNVAAADLNGDGWPEVISTNSNLGPNAKVFLNFGGILQEGVEYTAGSPRSVTIADFDADGDLDMAVPTHFVNVVSVLRNFGDGTFADAQNHPVGFGAMFAAVGDFNSDGLRDLAVSSVGSQVTSPVAVLMNTGSGPGGFAPAVNYDVGYDARGIISGDLDNDGDADLAVVVSPQARVFVLANNGDGTFAPALTFPCGQPGDTSYHLAGADVNADGRVDLAVTNMGITGGVTVLLNTTDSCYADCNADGVLTIADFACFQTAFVKGETYADCDRAGGLTIADFGCFQTAFVGGCP
jgi:FG-GAP-like repeat